MENYHPISLLPAVSDILAKVVCEVKGTKLDFLENSCLFLNNQFGVCKGKSITIALINFVENVLMTLSQVKQG